MAAKLVVAFAVLAVCQSTPALFNGAMYRNARGYSIGQAYSNGGASSASANVNGDAAQAYGSATGSQLADFYTYNANPGYGSEATAQAQNGYYNVPAPATVVTYEQNFQVPKVSYEIPAAINAQSSAVSDGTSDSSVSSATSNGAGIAESSAQTQRGVGSYGVTSTNAKTYGSGYGSAASNANAGPNSAVTSAQTHGVGAASSTAQTNGVVGAGYPVETTIVDAKRTYEAAYVPSVPAYVSSNTNVNGYGNAVSSAKATNGKTIGWRFGTAYSVPTPTAHANANANGYGSANANAKVNGAGYVNTYNAGYSSAKSSANANGGVANTNSEVNGGYGSANSMANTQYGTAKSAANTNSGYGYAKSNANTLPYYGGAKTEADAQTNGIGSANSSARTQGVSATFKVSESSANSSGYGSAHAKAQA